MGERGDGEWELHEKRAKLTQSFACQNICSK